MAIFNLKSKKLGKTLDQILMQLDALRGGFDLDKMFLLVGEQLLKLDISTLILIFDQNRENLIVRHCSLAQKQLKSSATAGDDLLYSVVGVKIPVKKLRKYNQILQKKTALFDDNRRHKLIDKLPELNKILKNDIKFNSIITPINVRGEIIGVIEFISTDLEEENLSLYENFSVHLVKTMANSILYQEIKKSEERYRQLVDGAADGVAIISPKGYLAFANKAITDITGYSWEELSTMHFSKIVHQDDRTMAINRFQDGLKGLPAPTNFEFRILNRNNETIYLSFTGSILREKGKIIGIQIMVRDITEEKKLAEKIESAKNHYEQIIDTINDGLCAIDKNFRIQSCNRTFAQKVNKNFSEIKGQRCFDILPLYENGAMKNHCARHASGKTCSTMEVLKTGKTKFFVEECRNDRGNSRFYNISIFPTKDSQGKIYQVVMTIRDVTSQRRAEEQIRRLNEFNQRILDNAPVSIVVLDKQGTIISANGFAKTLLDKPDKKIVGQKLIDTKEIKKNKILLKMYEDLLRDGRPLNYENIKYFSEKDQQERCLSLIAVPLHDENQQVDGAISMAIDNTEKIRAKEKLEDLNRNLELKVLGRTKELDETNKKLQQAISLKSKFIADASHELRTPLTVMQGNLELAVREAQESKCTPPEYYDLILNEVERMTSILSDLTMLTYADSNHELMMREEVNLGKLISAVARSLKVLADQKKITITYKKGAKDIKILGDETKLEKLLLNITRNAIKYTEPKGKISLWVENDTNEARINIEDNGIGIPKEDLPFIFERFYRVDKARSREEGGTGLGLAICKWIAEIHHGRIEVKSEEGKGSTFTVHLPVHSKVRKKSLTK